MKNNIKKLSACFFILLGAAIPISIAATSILIGLLSFCWIIEGGFKIKLEKIKSTKWMIAALLFILIYILGMFWGQYHDNAQGTFQILSLFLMFIVFQTSNLSQQTLKWGGLMFLSSTLASAIIATLINQGIILSLHDYIPIIADPENSLYPNAVDQKPAFITYTAHNILLAFSCMICLFLLIEKNSKYKLILMSCVLIYFFNIFYESGRAGQLIVVLLLSSYSVFYFRKKMKYSISIILFLIISIFSLYQFSWTFKHRVNHTINEVVNEVNPNKIAQPKAHSKFARFLLVKEALNFIKEKPVFGHGTGSFAKTFSKKINLKLPSGDVHTPHNTYLYVWCETGIIGLMILLSIFYLQIKSLSKLSHRFHRILLPTGLMTIMFFDSYLFSFIITVFYIYWFTIYNNYKIE